MYGKNGLLKNFLIYGIALLGGIYILSTHIVHTSFSDMFGYQFTIEWYFLKLIVVFLICLSAIGWVISKVWIAGRRSNSRMLWVCLAIFFIFSVSSLLLFLSFLSLSVD